VGEKRGKREKRETVPLNPDEAVLSGEGALDPELASLPSPPRGERGMTLALLVATALASIFMVGMLARDAAYAFAPSQVADLGEDRAVCPTASGELDGAEYVIVDVVRPHRPLNAVPLPAEHHERADAATSLPAARVRQLLAPQLRDVGGRNLLQVAHVVHVVLGHFFLLGCFNDLGNGPTTSW